MSGIIRITIKCVGVLLGISVTMPPVTAQIFPHYDFRIVPVEETNTYNNDYAPTLSRDHQTLWFCSYDRPEGVGNADIYRSERALEGGWRIPANAGETWNDKENEGALAIASDNTTVVIAMDGGKGIGDTDLYIAELEDDSIVNLTNLGKNVNSRYWDSQPSITGNGKTIYFASNRPGGYGGVDIWVTHKTAEGWSQAFPLDTTINSVENERSPYVIASGTSLFFSSDRPGGLGGEDFWVSYLETGDWSKPINLGSEINSSWDELFFHAPPGSDYFYFASNRPGSAGMLDIYSGSPNIFGDGRYLLDISVTDTTTGKPVRSYVTVTDTEEDHIVWEFSTDSVGLSRYRAILPAGREYQITARRSLKDVVSTTVTASEDQDKHEISLGFDFLRNILPEERELILFDLGEYNVPFFVTGYYRPNTPESLPTLLDAMDGELAKATYIERFPRESTRHNEYREYAVRIDSIFDDMARQIIDSISPAFLNHAPENEVMEMVVTGYVDPQIFSGLYLEDPIVEFADANGERHRVQKGDRIQNFELSGMRAVFAQQLIDQMLRRKATEDNRAFLDLIDAGRVRYRVVAGGVYGGQTEYDKQRRIHVLIVRAEKSEE